jgi:hypothetical protein
VVLEPLESGIVIRPLDTVIREVQAFFSGIKPANGLLSDELIRDRRENPLPEQPEADDPDRPGFYGHPLSPFRRTAEFNLPANPVFSA